MANDRPPAVRVALASKSFVGGHVALHGVTFDVEPAERAALLGASGSGKSTLLRCLSGLATLDARPGRIELFGRTLQADGRLAPDVRALRRHVGLVFQQFNLVGRLPVLSNVLAGASGRVPWWRALTGRSPGDAAWPSVPWSRGYGGCWPTSRWPRSAPNRAAA